MARDTWQVLRPVVKTEKISKYIDIPAFSLTSFWTNRSLKTREGASRGTNVTAATTELQSAFTIEFWAYSAYALDGKTVTFFTYEGATDGNAQVKIQAVNRLLFLTLTIGGDAKQLGVTVFPKVPIGKWFHVAVTYNGTIAKIYLNNERWAISPSDPDDEGPSEAYMLGPLDEDPSGNYIVHFCEDEDEDNVFYGYIDEIRIWSDERSWSELSFSYDKPIPKSGDNLALYFPFDTASESAILLTTKEEVSGATKAMQVASMTLSTDRYAPIGIGAANLLAEYALTFDEEMSLQYPIENPEGDDLNFGLFVSWIDSDGVFQRRELFKPDSGWTDPGGYPAKYAGENIGTSPKLEIFSKDGEDTASLTSDLRIYLSKTTNPEDGTDHDNVEEEELTADTTLAAASPLAYPLSFTNQQTFP